MPHPAPFRLAAALAATLTAGSAAALDTFSTGVLIESAGGMDPLLKVEGSTVLGGFACIGHSCPSQLNTASNEYILRLDASNYQPWVLFANLGTPNGTGLPKRDWRLRVNDDWNGGFDRFSVEDLDADTIPFTVEGAAPENAFWLASSGNIGLGTALPARDLHLVGGNSPALRLEQDQSGGFGNHTWDLMANDSGFLLLDVGTLFSTVPFRVENGAYNSSLILSSNGNIGMGPGAATPAAALHLHRNQGNAQMLIEEVNATANPRTLLNLQNNGRPEIVMGNTATNGEWSFGAGTDFFLKTGTVGSTSGAKTKVFTVKGNGDAIVAGTLTTGGTTCGGGCDRVFTDRAVIPAPDYAAQMWSQGHLPHVGPTVEGAPLNVSEKLGGMLNALEHAHVFIDAQNARIATLEADKAAQDARIARLEARLAALTGEN